MLQLTLLFVGRQVTTTLQCNSVALFFRSDRKGAYAMKPREDGGVPDENLNIYGTLNLKVADKVLPLSIH